MASARTEPLTIEAASEEAASATTALLSHVVEGATEEAEHLTAVYSKLEQHTDTTLRDCVDASERCRAEIASRYERLAPYLVEIDAIEQQVNMLAQAAAALDEMSQQVAGQVQQLGRG